MRRSNVLPGEAARRRPVRLRIIIAFLLLLALITLVLAELAARLLTTPAENGMPCIGGYPLLPYRPEAATVIEWLRDKESATYVIADAELGWTLAKSAAAGETGGDERYETNAEGARAPRNRVYGPTPPPGKTRIVTVGDSFTHGDEVAAADTWQCRLELMRPDLEVINLGVPGYGTDQALLRWQRDGRALNAGIVVLGIWPENICRNLNIARYYLNPAGAFTSKPRFVLTDSKLTLINSPVLDGAQLAASLAAPEGQPLFAHDRWYRPTESSPRFLQRLRIVCAAASIWNLLERRAERHRLYADEDPAGNDLAVAIANQFAADVTAAGAHPVIMIIPMRDLLAEFSAKDALPLARKLRKTGLDVIDLTPAMARALQEIEESEIYLPGGHLSPRGNSKLAEFLAAEISASMTRAGIPK